MIASKRLEDMQRQVKSLNWSPGLVFIEITAMLIIVVFLYTAVSKLLDFEIFKEQITKSPLFANVAPVVIWGVPITEIMISILLFLPLTRLIGLLFSAILMGLFTIYVAALLMIDSDLPCSCGGILATISWPAHLVINITLTGLSLVAYLILKRMRVMNT